MGLIPMVNVKTGGIGEQDDKIQLSIIIAISTIQLFDVSFARFDVSLGCNLWDLSL